MKSEACFFDFDGVIVDSVDIKASAFSLLFETHGKEVQKKVMTHHLNNGGMTRREKIKYYFEKYLNKKISNSELNVWCEKFSMIVEKEVVAAPEISGAEDFLKKVYKKIKCFIVSATPDNELKRIVHERGLEKYFVEILGSNRSKSENLRYLLKKYNFNSLNCRFFGDAINDHKAAKDCSVPFIGIIPDMNAPLLEKEPDILWVNNFQNKNIDSILEKNE